MSSVNSDEKNATTRPLMQRGKFGRLGDDSTVLAETDAAPGSFPDHREKEHHKAMTAAKAREGELEMERRADEAADSLLGRALRGAPIDNPDDAEMLREMGVSTFERDGHGEKKLQLGQPIADRDRAKMLTDANIMTTAINAP